MSLLMRLRMFSEAGADMELHSKGIEVYKKLSTLVSLEHNFEPL